jgi:hypothetical protein
MIAAWNSTCWVSCIGLDDMQRLAEEYKWEKKYSKNARIFCHNYLINVIRNDAQRRNKRNPAKKLGRLRLFLL